jgi:hypothetical protein
MTFYWMLDDDGEPQAVEDVLVWTGWMETADRHVLAEHVGRVWISTVFLGLDHNHYAAGPPVLWETMIFGGVFDGYQLRYSRRLDALQGHLGAVLLIEQYRHAPRRTRKSVRKARLHETRVTHGDAVRFDRFTWRYVRLAEAA